MDDEGGWERERIWTRGLYSNGGTSCGEELEVVVDEGLEEGEEKGDQGTKEAPPMLQCSFFHSTGNPS